MAKYKKQVEEMLEIHKDIFIPFKDIHDKYLADPEKWQEKLNEEGDNILRIIRRWENNLCSKTESGRRYGKFSSNLSEKFWEEIRSIFPKIDSIGLINP
ncbi:MAG: hypothetical protein M1365_12715 [Actinobacteria bacterium]|nr:hypothetical protein [Actinomycetota bacterium]